MSYSKDYIHKMVNVGFSDDCQINNRGGLAGFRQHFHIPGFGKSWLQRRDKKWLREVQKDRTKE